MKNLLVLIFLFALIVTNKVDAQIFTQVIDEQELQFKVKQIDEFFQRFNFETNYKGESVTEQNDSIPVDTLLKRKGLMTLLNLDTFANKENGLDSVSTDFLNYVINNDKKIHYTDTTWYAEAVSSFVMDGKCFPIRFTLKTENVKDVIYKWVISSVETPVFDCLTDTVKSVLSIMPGAHGSSFITLPEVLNLNAKNAQVLFEKNYHTNKLTVFAYLLSTGKVKLQNVTKVIYHFQLDDYVFIVERFEKENSYNKGWLISKITKETD